jgi:hypothetical protein
MRIFFALIISIIVSFIITPIGGVILFLLIVFTGKKKTPLPQRISTNVTVNNNQDSKKINVADELEKLHNLKEKGVITSDEFETKKKRLLQ